MIDGLYKTRIDPLWDKAARPLARLMTANQVTVMGFVIVLALCAAYARWGSGLWFGLGLALAFCTDSLDGAVARIRNEASRFGGYLDAMTDRYQELAVLLTLAWVNDVWPQAFLGLAGSYLTSYAKARTAIEMPIDNAAWPDLFERQERVLYLCALLILDASLSGYGLLAPGLWLFAALAHATALQRFFRARSLLRGQDRPDGP
jgi:archaetidylinositol phosphate synthase